MSHRQGCWCDACTISELRESLKAEREVNAKTASSLIDVVAELDRLRAWQKDAIDRIKVYINICDHQRVTGKYMSADTCVYCALDRALIDAALGAAVQPDDQPIFTAQQITENTGKPADHPLSLLDSQDSYRHPIHQVYFRAGLLACREYMARFVEVESPSIAASIRANWWPSLGKDFGPPRLLKWEELTEGEYGEESFRALTKDEISPTLEALPVALGFLERERTGGQPLAVQEIERANLVYERGAFVLMEMMKAYERRVRSDCKTQADLDAKPWECAEYRAAADFLRKTWPRNESHSGGNPGEPKACTPAEERGIAGATGAGQLPVGDGESTRGSAERRSPVGTPCTPTPDESNRHPHNSSQPEAGGLQSPASGGADT